MAVSDKKLAKQLMLLDSAYELFTQRGVNMTAIDDVVKKAGVAKGTFYLYFKDKYDLLDQIVLRRSEKAVLETMSELEAQAANEEKSPVELLHSFIDKLIAYFEKNKDLLALIEKNLTVCLELVLNTENAVLAARLEKLYEMFAACGYGREKAKQYIYLLLNMVSAACCDSILAGKPFTTGEIRESIHEIIDKILKPEIKEEHPNA